VRVPPFGGRDLDCLWPYEAARAYDELSAVLSVSLVIEVNHPIDHLPLALANGVHVDCRMKSLMRTLYENGIGVLRIRSENVPEIGWRPSSLSLNSS
jgi:hypothetical protein